MVKTHYSNIWLQLWILSKCNWLKLIVCLVAWLHRILHRLIIQERSHLDLIRLVMLLTRRRKRTTCPTLQTRMVPVSSHSRIITYVVTCTVFFRGMMLFLIIFFEYVKRDWASTSSFLLFAHHVWGIRWIYGRLFTSFCEFGANNSKSKPSNKWRITFTPLWYNAFTPLSTRRSIVTVFSSGSHKVPENTRSLLVVFYESQNDMDFFY